MDATLLRPCAAEGLGTALLVVFGPGSLVAALRLGDGLLDYGGPGMVTLSFGLLIVLVVYAFGTTPGAHINPAVTLTLAARGRFPWRGGPVPARADTPARCGSPGAPSIRAPAC